MFVPMAHILCVDDDADWRQLLEIMLCQDIEDCKVTSVATSREAEILMENLSFDLYVLDYVLPDATGTELCRKIRQTNSDTPVIFYSAMARKIDRQTAMASGATEYLVKPNDLEQLTGTVKRLLNGSLQINPCGYGLANLQKRAAQELKNSAKVKEDIDRLY